MYLGLPVLNGPEWIDLLPTKPDRRAYRGELLAADPRCLYCGKPLREGVATLDHLVPLFRGGKNVRGNLVLACRACNVAKGGRTLDEWLEHLQAAQAAVLAAPRCLSQGSSAHVPV